MCPGSAYIKRCSTELGLQLLQEGKVLLLRSNGHAEGRGQHLLSKIIRHQGAQIADIEGGEVSKVILHELYLGRRGDGIHVGLKGHSLRS